MEMIVKGMLAVFWLVLIPGAAGAPFLRKKDTYTLAESFFAGYIFLFSAAELLSLLMIVLDMPLHVLSASYGGIALIMALWGCVCLKKQFVGNGLKNRLQLSDRGAWFWAAVILIALQVGMCVLMAHMDADDSFYVASATTNVYTDSVFSVNAYTGLPYRRLPKRYTLSQFPAFLSVISQLSKGLHPAIIAHAIYPAVFLPMAYGVQNCLAKKWFHGNKRSQGMYLFFAACLTSFSAYSTHSVGMVQMVRIWQGKALLASVLLPLLFYFCISVILEKDGEYPWIFLSMTNLACCLLSSMGILLAPLMTGCFLAVSLIMHRDPRRILKGAASCLPSLILGIVYLVVW